MFYKLSEFYRAVLYETDIVLLDLKLNRYNVLEEEASIALRFFIDSSMNCSLSPDILDLWSERFQTANLISPVSIPSSSISSPLKKGGLKDYTWVLEKHLLPFKEVYVSDIIQCFFALIVMARLLRKEGLQGIIKLFRKKLLQHTTWIIPNDAEINKLRGALEHACRYYPHEVVCLLWAVTFVYIGLKRHWKLQWVVGVQLYPFLAHAWVEKENKVIGDREDVNLYLGILLKEPNFDDHPDLSFEGLNTDI